MIQFLSSDSVVAIADGRNFFNLDLLQGAIPVYSTTGITNMEIMGREKLPAYLVTLNTGCQFISSSSSIEFEPFYTYMKPFSGLSTRYINSTYDLWKTQRFLIWKSNSGKKEYVIPKNLDSYLLDSIENLKSVSETDYLEFSKSNYRSRSGIHYFKSKLKNMNSANFTAGSNNGNFSGLTNEELVELCKKYYKIYPESKNIRSLLRIIKEDGNPIPESFSSYRFGGNAKGYGVLEEIVFNNLPYESGTDMALAEVITSEVTADKSRLLYLKNYKPKILKIEKIEPHIFIKVKSSNPIAIILKKDSVGYNTEGIIL